MNTYFATFTSGLQELIPDLLSSSLPDVIIKKCDDGFVLFASDEETERITSLRFFNNVFNLIKTFKDVGPGVKSMNNMVKKAVDDDNLFYHLNRKLPVQRLSFRVMFVRENQMVKHDRNVLERFEQRILENKKLKIDRSLPNVEFWFYMRREGDAYFGIRMTYHTEYAKILEKGELKPELAYILCALSHPKAGEIFLDPFAGWGGIPLERYNSFPKAHIYASDTDSQMLAFLHKRFQKKEVMITPVDALHMDAYEDASIDTIVTDPPWGVTQGTNLDLPSFYTEMLQEFHRVLKPHHRAVILVGRNDIFANILGTQKNLFTQRSLFHILVSGQRASIYVLEKKAT